MPTTPNDPATALPGRPPVVDLPTWQAARNELLVLEKAHTRKGVLDGGQDRVTVLDDPALEFDEGGDPAPAGPADPDFEGFDGLGVGQLEHQPQALLE